MSIIQLNTYEKLYAVWIKKLKLYSYFPDATTYENYRRLAVLRPTHLKEDTDDGFKDSIV